MEIISEIYMYIKKWILKTRLIQTLKNREIVFTVSIFSIVKTEKKMYFWHYEVNSYNENQRMLEKYFFYFINFDFMNKEIF